MGLGRHLSCDASAWFPSDPRRAVFRSPLPGRQAPRQLHDEGDLRGGVAWPHRGAGGAGVGSWSVPGSAVLGGCSSRSVLLRLNLFRMLGYFKEELVLIIGTSTAEPALPGLMRKLEFAGVRKETVGLVVPTGYSFNLDGAAIYLSLATLYIAQATNTPLTIGQQIGLLAVMLLTSKGAAGVAGGGFIALTATLSTLGTVPAVGIMLIFGVDKFMSECRALVNFCGNAVAALVIARWDRTLDTDRVRRVFRGEITPEAKDLTLSLPTVPTYITGRGSGSGPVATPAGPAQEASSEVASQVPSEVPDAAGSGAAHGSASAPSAPPAPSAAAAPAAPASRAREPEQSSALRP